MKDILVHVDASEACAHRLDVAVGLAQRMGARLTGLFAQSETDAPSLVARRASEHLRLAAAAAETDFLRRVDAAGVGGRWWQLPHGEPAYVVAEMAFYARYADLVVLGQPQQGMRVPEEMVEHVVLHCGRPVLVIPQGIASVGALRRISIAWNSSSEASRAVHDAMPLLRQADEISVLSLRLAGAPPLGRSPGEPQVDIVDHLAAHGLQARSERLTCDSIGVMDILLSRTFDLGADLLVMGAHSGLGVSRGAGTRYMLRHMTLPILMSN